ncbi:hypothetical protein [Aquimarina algiphila]|uniref:hypothetical protein n=1 Tax=Aquimarina algiphila TaxID=2047982 RepID=UPI00232AA23C|nr:hypothetical protein [Aquimarina algiphila]
MKTIKIINIIFIVFSLLSCEQTDLLTYEAIQQSTEKEKSISLILENQNKLSFINYDDNEVFILEESDCSNCSALDNLASLSKKDWSEAEIFWALSKTGQRVPAFLQTGQNVGKTFAKPQGWARDQVQTSINKGIENPGPSTVVACKNSEFTSSIAGGFLGNPEFVRLDKKPINYASFKNDCSNLSDAMCQKGKRYRYSATFKNIKKWRGKICAKSIQNSNNDHYLSNILCLNPPCTGYRGPKLYFEFKKDGVWKPIDASIKEGIEIPANKRKTYGFYKNASKKRSFRIRVKNAMKLDEFDFMMDKKANEGGGTPTPGGGGDVIPDYVSINDEGKIIIDFINIPDDSPSPQISIDWQALKDNNPDYNYHDNEGNIILPENFCGIKVTHAVSFKWLDKNGNIINNEMFNRVNKLSNYGEYGSFYVNEGIGFKGPLDNCKDNNSNWYFKFPLTHTTEGEATIFEEPLKLVIEGVDSSSKITFLE